MLLDRIASQQVVAVETLPETIRGAEVFGSSGLNVINENADISSAAAVDISVESVNILDHIQAQLTPI